MATETAKVFKSGGAPGKPSVTLSPESKGQECSLLVGVCEHVRSNTLTSHSLLGPPIVVFWNFSNRARILPAYTGSREEIQDAIIFLPFFFETGSYLAQVGLQPQLLQC